MNSILNVNNLNVGYSDNMQSWKIVDDVSFSLETASVLAIVGESGSGKTTLCRAMTRLFTQSSQLRVSGNIQFNSTDLLSCSEEALQKIRQTEIRYIFQEPQQALNPVLTICKQMKFASGRSSVVEDKLALTLESVGLRNADEVLNSYPHQLSIGMAQRVVVAMAILPKPLLLIADEPTSAIDVSLRIQLLDLLKSIQMQEQMAMIIVTHDLDVARRYADHIAVTQTGRIIELTHTEQFFVNPQHPYSQMLLDATPSAKKKISPISDVSI